MEKQDADLIEEIKNKKILHWNYRNFSELPEAIKYWGDHVQELYLKENILTCLPKWISDMKNITSLYLSGNKLDEFPLELGSMSRLIVLDLSSNNLTFLPANIRELKQLKELILDDNYLNQLPMELSELNNLELLSISQNNFSILPEWIGSLEKLEKLFIDNNYLEEMPNRLTLAPMLTTISICSNRLKYLPLNSFIAPVKIHFNCNPNLKYLSYSILCQLIELGWSGGKHCISTVSHRDSSTNINIKLMVKLNSEEKTTILLPRQLLKIFAVDNKIPVSLWELSLRMLYKNKFENFLDKYPGHWGFFNLLQNGPISICLNNQCQEPIFTEAWIALGYCDDCVLLVMAVFCCHTCACSFDAQSHGIQCLSWDLYSDTMV